MTTSMPFLRAATAACALLLATALPAVAATPATKAKPRPEDGRPFGRTPAVMTLAADIAEREPELDRDQVASLLAEARRLPAVRQLILPAPASGMQKNWAAYRARFVEPQRIAAGVQFWREHARWFEEAQHRHGVPAEIIAGVLGVETYYARHMGNFRVMDALATLALDFPVQEAGRDRSAFFGEELRALLKLSNEHAADPFDYRGSYAGAMGMPQFMPSSWLRWAVDEDGDGRIDLRNTPADAIGSVANYLAQHGWVPGLPTHFAVAPPADLEARARLLEPDIVPSFSAAEFAAEGAQLDAAAADFDEALLALVELRNGERGAPSYVAGTRNFYVVTRYNRSSYYALAVIELGQAVARAYRHTTGNGTGGDAAR